MTSTGRSLVVAACVKWADLRPEIDPLLGSVEPQHHGEGWSASDLAAIEVALRTAESWSEPSTVVVVCAGPRAAEDALRELLAAGVDRVVRIELATQPSSAEVAGLLAGVLAEGDLGADLVVCGDVSADRGSGAVPAFLAHELDASQALGLIEVTPGAPGELAALRRLDGARRERLVVQTPAVVSVEGSVADLRRASLAATLSARTATVEVRVPHSHPHTESVRTRPWRPRARVLPPPHGDRALDRIVQLTGAFTDRTPPRTLVLDPADAADAVLEQLRVWGYLDAEQVGHLGSLPEGTAPDVGVNHSSSVQHVATEAPSVPTPATGDGAADPTG